MGKILSLREYIDDYENQEEFKVSTFCRLMQIVSDAIEQVDRNLIRINLDDIKVDTSKKEIIFIFCFINCHSDNPCSDMLF